MNGISSLLPSSTSPGIGYSSTPAAHTRMSRRAKLTTSSLPPSSPIALELHSAQHDDQLDVDVDKENVPVSVRLEVEDPFGFVATEKKLKDKREARITRQAVPRAPLQPIELGKMDTVAPVAGPSLNLLEGSDDDYRGAHRRAFASLSESPTTPKGRRRKAKPFETPSSRHSKANRSSSPATTPSPTKPSRRRVMPDSIEGSEDDGGNATENANQGRTTRSRAKKRKEDLDGFAVTRQLEALLPRRPTRKVVDGTNIGTRKKAPSRQVTTKVKPVSKSDIAKKSASSKESSGSKKKAHAKEPAVGLSNISLGLDSDEREKFLSERQERKKYFQKLEDYSFQKEDMIII